MRRATYHNLPCCTQHCTEGAPRKRLTLSSVVWGVSGSWAASFLPFQRPAILQTTRVCVTSRHFKAPSGTQIQASVAKKSLEKCRDWARLISKAV